MDGQPPAGHQGAPRLIDKLEQRRIGVHRKQRPRPGFDTRTHRCAPDGATSLNHGSPTATADPPRWQARIASTPGPLHRSPWPPGSPRFPRLATSCRDRFAHRPRKARPGASPPHWPRRPRARSPCNPHGALAAPRSHVVRRGSPVTQTAPLGSTAPSPIPIPDLAAWWPSTRRHPSSRIPGMTNEQARIPIGR